MSSQAQRRDELSIFKSGFLHRRLYRRSPDVCACAAVTGLPEPQVTSLMNVPPEKTLIVGRVELHPPLQEGEQVLRSALGEEFRNVFILYCGDRLRDFKASRPDSFAGSFSATLDKEFFIKVEKGRTLFISGGTYYTVIVS